MENQQVDPNKVIKYMSEQLAGLQTQNAILRAQLEEMQIAQQQLESSKGEKKGE